MFPALAAPMAGLTLMISYEAGNFKRTFTRRDVAYFSYELWRSRLLALLERTVGSLKSILCRSGNSREAGPFFSVPWFVHFRKLRIASKTKRKCVIFFFLSRSSHTSSSSPAAVPIASCSRANVANFRGFSRAMTNSIAKKVNVKER